MLIVSHPTGNTFVRALLKELTARGLLETFYTTVAAQPEDWPLRFLPTRLQRQAARRAYEIKAKTLVRFPVRELTRLTAAKIGFHALTRHEVGWASVDSVYRDLDRRVANSLKQTRSLDAVHGVYCYEDCALQTFRAAAQAGLKRIYDLPIAHWQTSARLLAEEAQRWPEWEPTLVGTRDSAEKRERKTQELALAEVVITPSRFVYDSLPETIRAEKICRIVEFGSPPLLVAAPLEREEAVRPLRVLFAGSMTQRKGLADLFAAMKQLNRPDVELIVMGSPLVPLEFYRRQYADFRYESPRPHADVLRLMQSCDVLALPSIVEGRALVQQEALACGLPLLVTANAGGEDLIEEGKTGFLVPIRSPEAIAEKIHWFAERRFALPAMKQEAQRKAAEYTWKRYADALIAYAVGAPVR